MSVCQQNAKKLCGRDGCLLCFSRSLASDADACQYYRGEKPLYTIASRSSTLCTFSCKYCSEEFNKTPAAMNLLTNNNKYACSVCISYKNTSIVDRPDMIKYYRGKYRPTGIAANSKRKYSFSCSDCGQLTEISPNNIKQSGCRCRNCKSKRATIARVASAAKNNNLTMHPKMLASYRGEMSPELVGPRSTLDCEWQCTTCNTIFNSQPRFVFNYRENIQCRKCNYIKWHH